MSVRKSYVTSGQTKSNGVATIKRIALWGSLLIGSFLIGFLVISPLMNAAAGTRNDTKVEALNSAPPPSTRPGGTAAQAVIPSPKRQNTDDDPIKISPDKSDSNLDVQKPEKMDSEPSVQPDAGTRHDSNTDDTSGTSRNSARDNTQDAQPSDNTDRSGDTANTEKPHRTRRSILDKPGDTSSDETKPVHKRAKKHRKTDEAAPSHSNDSGDAGKGDTGVQKGEGIDR
jgi:hypothetical protein